MRILIADERLLATPTIRRWLEDLELCLESVVAACDGQAMKSIVRRCRPDVAFVDIRVPKINGLETIKACREISPQTKLDLFTGFPELEYAQEAIRLGVSGCVV